MQLLCKPCLNLEIHVCKLALCDIIELYSASRKPSLGTDPANQNQACAAHCIDWTEVLKACKLVCAVQRPPLFHKVLITHLV